MRGRKPKPKADVGGTLDRVPPAPSWLSKEAKAEWRRVMPFLVERRILTEPDLAQVEHYCVAVGQVRQCEAAIRTEPMFVQSATSAPRQHPAIRVQHAAIGEARILAAELGLTPVARARSAMAAGERDDNDAGLDL